MKKPADLVVDAEIAFAQSLYEQRRARAAHFSDLAFTEPAWDILLYLFIRQREMVTSGHACAGSGTNRTTALRHLDRLEHIGMIKRCDCDEDARVQFISLTEYALCQMRGYINYPEASERVSEHG